MIKRICSVLFIVVFCFVHIIAMIPALIYYILTGKNLWNIIEDFYVKHLPEWL